MANWDLELYETENGRCPVREYLDEIPSRERARVTKDLDLLAEFGIELGMPTVRPLVGKLWELRTTGRIQHRVLYVAISGRRLILLHAFTKKQQKTPPGEIATAQRRFADYLRRHEG